MHHKEALPGVGGDKMLEFERNKDREHKLFFCWVTEIILHHSPLSFFLKKYIFFGGSKARMVDFFYPISKKGTKVFLFFFGGGGEGWRRRRQIQSLRQI